MDREKRIKDMKLAREQSLQSKEEAPAPAPVTTSRQVKTAPRKRSVSEDQRPVSGEKVLTMERINELKQKKAELEQQKKKQLEKRKEIKKKLREKRTSSDKQEVKSENCKNDPLISPRTSSYGSQPLEELSENTEPTKTSISSIKELNPSTVTNMINQFCNYLAVILYSDGQMMAERSLSRVQELDSLFFKWNDGRRLFASSLVLLLQKLPSPCLSTDGFEVFLLLLHKLLAQIDADYDTADWIVAKVVMEAATVLYRVNGEMAEFVQEFIKPYRIWKDIDFWTNCFWDGIVELQEKQQLMQMQLKFQQKMKRRNSKGSKGSGEVEIVRGLAVPLRKVEVLSPKPREFNDAPDNSIVIQQVVSYAYNMLNWNVKVKIIKDFVSAICKKISLQLEEQETLLEVVDSFKQTVKKNREREKEERARPVLRRTQSERFDKMPPKESLMIMRASSPSKLPTNNNLTQQPKKNEKSSSKKSKPKWRVRGSIKIERKDTNEASFNSPKGKEKETEGEKAEKEKEKGNENDKESQAQQLVQDLTREVGRVTFKNTSHAMFQEVQLSRRDKVLDELIATEKTYVDHMKVVVQECLLPLEEKNYLTPSEVKGVFSNLKDILALNVTLLERLESRAKSWHGLPPSQHLLSDIFLQTFPFMKIYHIYTSNFLDSTKLTFKLLAENIKFKESCIKLSCRKDALDLSSYLIMPIQRIPRYKLLLEELVKETHPCHPDYKNLTNALEIIKEVASFVNDSQGKEWGKLVELQMLFGKSVNLIEPWRKHVKEGKVNLLVPLPTLTSGVGYEEHEVVVYIFTDLMLLARPNGRYLGHLFLAETWVKDIGDIKGHANLFSLHSPPRSTLTFTTSAHNDKYTWIKDIATTITKLLESQTSQKKRIGALPALPVEDSMNAFLPESVSFSMDDYPFSVAEFSTKGYLMSSIGKKFGSIFGSGSTTSPSASRARTPAFGPGPTNSKDSRPRLQRSVSELDVKQTRW